MYSPFIFNEQGSIRQTAVRHIDAIQRNSLSLISPAPTKRFGLICPMGDHTLLTGGCILAEGRYGQTSAAIRRANQVYERLPVPNWALSRYSRRSSPWRGRRGAPCHCRQVLTHIASGRKRVGRKRAATVKIGRQSAGCPYSQTLA